jgi:hypothetical protein
VLFLDLSSTDVSAATPATTDIWAILSQPNSALYSLKLALPVQPQMVTGSIQGVLHNSACGTQQGLASWGREDHEREGPLALA